MNTDITVVKMNQDVQLVKLIVAICFSALGWIPCWTILGMMGSGYAFEGDYLSGSLVLGFLITIVAILFGNPVVFNEPKS